MSYIKRDIETEVLSASKQYPVITITGPRQSGKTTMVKKLFKNLPYFSLENPDIRSLAINDPRAFLGQNKYGAILDEIQHVPHLLSYLQQIVDENKHSINYILTGSNQFSILNKLTQSLAGRTAILKLLPLTLNEIRHITKNNTDELILHGFYPAVYSDNLNPTKAYRNYYETYLERDLRQIFQIKNLSLFQKFIHICAGRIGNIFNASSIATEVGVSVTTIKSWMSILEASFIVLLLQPYYENINKRLIKSPKIYFYDVGLAAYLLGIEDARQISRDPLRGALFENLVLMELVKYRFNTGFDHNLFFYRDSHQNEVDVVFKKARQLYPVEIKSAQTFHP
ncbi:MAG: ATP-binding protein [Bacteroidales bacterium]|nr:ATP-binding protein [Bacteroidales bacterium]